jgi:glutaminase
VRGIAVCKKISSDFGLHMFHTGRASAASVIHARYDAAQVPSKRDRDPEQNRILSELGHKVMVFELQGDLVFATAEIVIHESMREVENADFLILDFTRVGVIDESALSLIADFSQALFDQAKQVLITGHSVKHELEEKIKNRIEVAAGLPLLDCEDIDHALEWCEQNLLANQFPLKEGEIPLAAQSLCAGFSTEELELLESMLERRSYQQGTYLCREGDLSNALFFILSGQVTLSVPLASGRAGRFLTLAAGSAFGEMSMLDQGAYPADIFADLPVSCAVLDNRRLESETSSLADHLRLKLFANVARALAKKLRQATLEIKSLRS